MGRHPRDFLPVEGGWQRHPAVVDWTRAGRGGHIVADVVANFDTGLRATGREICQIPLTKVRMESPLSLTASGVFFTPACAAGQEDKSRATIGKTRTKAVHSGTRRSQYNEVSEAVFLTQGFVYRERRTAAEARFQFDAYGDDEFILAPGTATGPCACSKTVFFRLLWDMRIVFALYLWPCRSSAGPR